MAGGGLVRSVHPITVKPAGAGVRQVDMPDLVGLLRHPEAVNLLLRRGGVEDTEIHGGRIFGKQREVDTLSVPGRAQGVGASRHGSHRVIPQG